MPRFLGIAVIRCRVWPCRPSQKSAFQRSRRPNV